MVQKKGDGIGMQVSFFVSSTWGIHSKDKDVCRASLCTDKTPDGIRLGLGLVLHRDVNALSVGLGRNAERVFSFSVMGLVVVVECTPQADGLGSFAVNVVQIDCLPLAIL